MRLFPPQGIDTILARFTRSWAGMDTAAITLLIDELAAERVQLHVEGGALRYRAPAGALTPERQALLDTHHDEIRDFVRARSHAGVRPPRVPGAQAVWAPTPVQTSVLQWSVPTVMRELRPVPVLDPVAAQAALDEMIARHDALRMRYTKDDEGRYWAVTEQRIKVSIEYADISTLSAEARNDRLHEITAKLLDPPFDLQAGPLLRMGLVRVGEWDMLSLLATCHSIFDWHSRDLFYREFLILHHAFRSGTAPGLLPAPQFRDYAQQINGRLNGELGYKDFIYIWNRVLGRALDFPRAVLFKAGAPGPGAQPAAIGQRATSLVRYRAIEVQQLASLRSLARCERMTPSACALAAVGIALRSCASSQDAFVWLVQSARITPQMMGLIGCCAIHSFFPMRFSNEQTLREVLRTVWQTYLEDMKHLVPGQNLKPISNQARAAGVFLGTEFNYLLSAPPEPPADASRANFSLPLEEDGSAFPLRVCFYESEHGLAWSVRYRSAQLEDETVERVSIRVGQILARMTQDVDVRLDNMKC